MLRLCERGLGCSLVRADVLVESEEVRRAPRSKFLIAGAGFEPATSRLRRSRDRARGGHAKAFRCGSSPRRARRAGDPSSPTSCTRGATLPSKSRRAERLGLSNQFRPGLGATPRQLAGARQPEVDARSRALVPCTGQGMAQLRRDPPRPTRGSLIPRSKVRILHGPHEPARSRSARSCGPEPERVPVRTLDAPGTGAEDAGNPCESEQECNRSQRHGCSLRCCQLTTEYR